MIRPSARAPRFRRGSAFALFALFASGCGRGDDPAKDTAAPTATITAAAAPTATAPPGMTLAGFCQAHDAKLDALLASCVEKDDPTLYQLVASGIRTSKQRCQGLQNVRVVEAMVSACLDEVKTWRDASLDHLQYRPTCREALVGEAEDGTACVLALSCKPGSQCLPKPEGDDPARVCTPAPKEDSPCRVQAGHSCGPELDCDQDRGKCVARAKANEPCGSGHRTCAEGLTCLRGHHKSPTGTCGKPRDEHDGCHHWAECKGRCKTAAPVLKDGFCAAFCGSG